MSLLIDGYNLLHAANIIGRGRGPGYLERARLALLNSLATALASAELKRTIVVFDAAGAPPGLPPNLEHRGLRVRFARDYPDADALLEELIAADSAPRKLTVVSSDHRVQRAAKRRRCKCVDADVWYAELIARKNQAAPVGRAAAAEGPKPPAPVSPSEVEFWLRQFGELDVSSGEGEVFPPGYGEE